MSFDVDGRKPEIKFDYFSNNFLESALNWLNDSLIDYKPDFIISISRNGPRIIDFISELSPNFNHTMIVSDRALDYLPKSNLEGKKLALIDDIIVLGTTIHDYVNKIENAFSPKEVKSFVLAIDRDTNIISRFKKKIDLAYFIEITSKDRFIFSQSVANSFVFLNKPYDLDYPIFYNKVKKEKFNELIVFFDSKFDLYELTTNYQSNNEFLRFTLLIKLSNNLFKPIDKEIKKNFHIAKFRIYYDIQNENLTITPIFTLEINNEQVIELFKNIIKNLESKTEFEKELKSITTFAKYKLIVYLLNFKLWFSLFDLMKETIFDTEFSTKMQDRIYLFGESFDKIVEKLIQKLPFIDFSITHTSPKRELLEFLNKENTNMSTILLNLITEIYDVNIENKNIIQEIAEKTAQEMDSNFSIVENLSLIFSNLYFLYEDKLQKELRSTYQLEGIENKYKRLKKGFTFNQLKLIISKLYIDNTQLIERLDQNVSVAIDNLVDIGIMIPIYCENKNKIYRSYRYGENSFRGRQFGFLIWNSFNVAFDELCRRTNKNCENEGKYVYLDALTIEKMGVWIFKLINIRDIRETSRNIPIVEYLKSPYKEERSIQISRGTALFGAIVKVGDIRDNAIVNHAETKNGMLFNKWCEHWKIIEGTKRKSKLSLEYIDNLNKRFDETYDFVSDFDLTFIGLSLSYILIIDSMIDKSKNHDFLITLSTLDTPINYIKAICTDFYLFFINNIILSLGSFIFERIEHNQQYIVHSGILKDADIAINQVKHKTFLKNQMNKTLEDISNFFTINNDNHYKIYLHSYLERIKMDWAKVSEQDTKDLINRITIFSDKVKKFSDIVKTVFRIHIGKNFDKYEIYSNQIVDEIERISDLKSIEISAKNITKNESKLDRIINSWNNERKNWNNENDRTYFVQSIHSMSNDRVFLKILEEIYQSLKFEYETDFTFENLSDKFESKFRINIKRSLLDF